MKRIITGVMLSLIIACDGSRSGQEELLEFTREIVENNRENLVIETVQDNLQAAQRGDAEAQWKLGNLMLLLWTYGQKENDAQKEEVRLAGNRWLHKAAEKGNPYAMLDLASAINGVTELEEAQRQAYAKKAFAVIENKSEKNSDDASYLSRCYVGGFGVEKDLEKAYRWYSTMLDMDNVPPERRKVLEARWRQVYSME